MKKKVVDMDFNYIPKEFDSGTIIEVYPNGVYLMEFMDKKGKTVGLVDMMLFKKDTATKKFIWK